MKKQFRGIACARLYTPREVLENVLVLFNGSHIGEISPIVERHDPDDIYDARDAGLIVTPGLIEAHMHGCAGADFLDYTRESLERISLTAASGGASSVLATTTIPTDDTSLERFKGFAHLFRETLPLTLGSEEPSPLTGARYLGLYLEGPFINPDKRGGFSERFVNPVDLQRAQRIVDICGDLLLKITISPEIRGAKELIQLFLDALPGRIEISLGHSSADYGTARRFFDMKHVRQVTHAFNTMTPLHHREPGLIGAALLDDNVMLEAIPDGWHLCGPIIELIYRMKGPRRTILITDGTAATATSPGTPVKSVGGVTLVRNGAVRLRDGTLAGSNLLIAGAMDSAMKLGNIPFVHALEMCTLTPAASVNMETMIGSIEPGKLADFTVLHEDCRVAAVIRDGALIPYR
ncbi:MAG: N-acetylglucosamine-6-phosphate deacetylase [bacterium]